MVFRSPERSNNTLQAEIKKNLIFRFFRGRKAFFVMPKPGIEPGWYCYRWILSPVRLPISPLRQVAKNILY